MKVIVGFVKTKLDLTLVNFIRINMLTNHRYKKQCKFYKTKTI